MRAHAHYQRKLSLSLSLTHTSKDSHRLVRKRMDRVHDLRRARETLLSLFLFSLATLSECGNTWADTNWVNHGNGILNQRSAIGQEQKINRMTVKNLQVAWTFTTGFDVSATPCVGHGMVYFPGWNHMLYALDEEQGELKWQKSLSDLAGEMTNGSRATPVLWNDLLLVGIRGPPIVLAINCHTGNLVWKTQRLDNSAFAIITMSGTAYKGFYYVGVSSKEETYTCCTFQGSFQKIRIKDGVVVWRTYMLPPNSGYYGAALWGSSPSIDEKRQLVFIATGNNYKVPKSVEACENARTSGDIQSSRDPCLDPLNHEDSMLALSLDTGFIVWSRNFQAYDVWTIPCSQNLTSRPNCPSTLGPDYDFGEAPMIVYLDTSPQSNVSSTISCIVVAGQKSGVVWAVDCDTGSTIWSTAAGPGGHYGGASWGLSSDGERVYTNIINDESKPFTLVPRKEVTRGGGWVCMEAKTGKVLWTVAEPSRALAFGPMTVANGIVFGTSFTSATNIFSLDALTGAILWQASTGAVIYGGVSISRSCLFLGNGYTNAFLPNIQNGTAFFAFCLPKSN